MTAGKLIVFEGTDGSGKRTQQALLTEFLKAHNIPFATMDFPRYRESLFGELAGRMLVGEFGGIDQLPSHLAVLPFAADRWLLKDDLKRWLSVGKLVISNRYTASSAVYYGAKLPADKRREFIRWVYRMEQDVIGLPKEDLVIYLRVPLEIAQRLIDKRAAETPKEKDEYEKNRSLLFTVEKLYAEIAQKEHWKTIDCVKDGVLLSTQEIHKKVLEILEPLFFERTK